MIDVLFTVEYVLTAIGIVLRSAGTLEFCIKPRPWLTPIACAFSQSHQLHQHKTQCTWDMSAISIDSSRSEHSSMDYGALSPRQYCWEQSACTQPSLRDAQPYASYGALRVIVTSNEDADDAQSCPGTPPACTSKQLHSQRRLPAPALLKLVTSPASEAEDEESAEMRAQQLRGCPSARRLLTFEDDNSNNVSSWLDQQISMRTSARSAPGTSSSSHMCDLPTAIKPGGAFAGTAAGHAGYLPPPAFQLLGLL